MKALIVYESFFGNTERVANAIGAAIGGALNSSGSVVVRKAADVTAADLAGLGLLVVGAPTRAFKPSPGMAQWLAALPADAVRGVKVAAFDTRISPEDAHSGLLKVLVRLFGWAAEKIEKQLVSKGGALAAPLAGFYVLASEGPLRDGELDRAAGWARQVAMAK